MRSFVLSFLLLVLPTVVTGLSLETALKNLSADYSKDRKIAEISLIKRFAREPQGVFDALMKIRESDDPEAIARASKVLRECYMRYELGWASARLGIRLGYQLVFEDDAYFAYPRVQSIGDDSLAKAAGLKIGDMIISVNDVVCRSITPKEIFKKEQVTWVVGQKVKLIIVRCKHGTTRVNLPKEAQKQINVEAIASKSPREGFSPEDFQAWLQKGQ